MVVSCLVTLELTGITVSFNSAPLEWWLSLPIIVVYPLLFGWVSYQTATKLAEHKRRLQVMSTRDGMTGVYNRRHWETMLRNEFDNCRRHNRDATLLIIDIDHFKSINDTWGHDVGDEAIVALTRQLQITLRGSDVIGRFGGDEFAVIMSGTPAESAITAMLRVREGLNTLRLPNTPQVTLRISVGVAPLNPQMSHYREWLKSADLALYKAKKAGRNRTEVATSGESHQDLLSFSDFSIHFVIASITAARKPFSSSTRTASMVVPPGEQTISFSAPGCSPVSSTIFAEPITA